MASLKEIRSRIASVNSTLKITSAMKMVASAKLHRVQSNAEALTEYEKHLSLMASVLVRRLGDSVVSPLTLPHKTERHAAVVAIASNGSLCGAFNANAVHALEDTVKRLHNEGVADITIYPVGEKIVQAAHKAGYDTCDDFQALAGAPASDRTTDMARRLMVQFTAGMIDRVLLVYNHFHSMGHQKPCEEIFLPMDFSANEAGAEEGNPDLYLFEPEAPRLLDELIPYVLRTRMYRVLLDSATAEHAARTVAMQTASDNARELLDELSLSYNKRRQQAITDELADIAGAN